MNITFIADFTKMTYEHYLLQPKPMIEWKFNLLFAKNPNLAKLFDNSTYPLIRKMIVIFTRVMEKIGIFF